MNYSNSTSVYTNGSGSSGSYSGSNINNDSSVKIPTSPVLSPKLRSQMDMLKSTEDESSRQHLMKKKSPSKDFSEKSGEFNINSALSYGGSSSSNGISAANNTSTTLLRN